MSKDLIIRVRVVQDKEFKNSYWSFDIQKELKEAFQEFKRQFGVGFRIREMGKWNSIGSPKLRDFPLNILKQLRMGISETEVVEDLVRIVNNQMRIPWEISQEERKCLCGVLKKKAKDYQLGYLMAWFSGFPTTYLLQDLRKKIPKTTKDDIIVGFTGKIVGFSEKETFPLGKAVRKSAFGKNPYALVGICSGLSMKPSHVILHEFGHLFGAEHLPGISVMNGGPTYDFDEENKKTIQDFLAKLS